MEKKSRIIISLLLIMVAIMLLIIIVLAKKVSNNKEKVPYINEEEVNEEYNYVGFHYFLNNNNKKIAMTINEDYTCTYSEDEIPCTWQYVNNNSINVTTPYFTIRAVGSGAVLYGNDNLRTKEKCNEALKRYLDRYVVNAECVESSKTELLTIEK